MAEATTTCQWATHAFSDFLNLNYSPTALGTALLLIPLLCYPFLPRIGVFSEVVVLAVTFRNVWSNGIRPVLFHPPFFQPWMVLWMFASHLLASAFYHIKLIAMRDPLYNTEPRFRDLGSAFCLCVWAHMAWEAAGFFHPIVAQQPVVIETLGWFIFTVVLGCWLAIFFFSPRNSVGKAFEMVSKYR